jgi:SepF-like predicted cell division protein (DUF552 family)
MISKKITNIDLKTFYKESKLERNMQNLLALLFWKSKIATIINTMNKDKTHVYQFRTIYKERRRAYTEIKDDDWTHFMTITYKHPTYLRNSFDIMLYNELFRYLTNQGIHRMRSNFNKAYNDKLKKKIKDKKKRQFIANKLKNENFKYVKVYEVHKNGFIHVHILVKFPPEFRRRDFKEMIQIIANWFETDTIGVDLKRIKSGKRRTNEYVMKYLKKSFWDESIVKQTIDENGRVYYAIRLDAFYTNDIPRLMSYSRNCEKKKRVKTQKCISTRKLTDSKEDTLLKELNAHRISAERVPAGIPYISYENEFIKTDVEKFRKLKAKRTAHREIKAWEERQDHLAVLEDYVNGKINIVDAVISHNRDDEMKKVMKALYGWERVEKEIKQRYSDIIAQAYVKFRKDDEFLSLIERTHQERIHQEQPEEIEWVEF